MLWEKNFEYIKKLIAERWLLKKEIFVILFVKYNDLRIFTGPILPLGLKLRAGVRVSIQAPKMFLFHLPVSCDGVVIGFYSTCIWIQYSIRIFCFAVDASSSPIANPKKDPASLIHLIDSMGDPPSTHSALTVDGGEARHNLLSSLSQSSTTSQSRSNSSHQVWKNTRMKLFRRFSMAFLKLLRWHFDCPVAG